MITSNIQFWGVLTILFIVAAASIRLGWVLAMAFVEKHFNEEMKEQAKKHFQENYYQGFVDEFNKQVEKRAKEIVDDCLKQYEEEQNKENKE